VGGALGGQPGRDGGARGQARVLPRPDVHVRPAQDRLRVRGRAHGRDREAHRWDRVGMGVGRRHRYGGRRADLQGVS
jgi:hypothetical protein